MTTTSQRQVTFSYSANAPGDFTAQPQTIADAPNATSPGPGQHQNLVNGVNTFTIPSGATAVSIFPPPTNTLLITLKGASGDTGVPLNKTGWTSIGLDSTATSIILNAAGAISGVLILWH